MVALQAFFGTFYGKVCLFNLYESFGLVLVESALLGNSDTQDSVLYLRFNVVGVHIVGQYECLLEFRV